MSHLYWHRGVSKSFRKLIDRLKLNDGIDDPRQRVYFHTLRHTFASWLAIKSTPILTIKELLGHKTLAMTERYAHLSPDHKRTAASGVDDMLKVAQDKKASEDQQDEEEAITEKNEIQSKLVKKTIKKRKKRVKPLKDYATD